MSTTTTTAPADDLLTAIQAERDAKATLERMALDAGYNGVAVVTLRACSADEVEAALERYIAANAAAVASAAARGMRLLLISDDTIDLYHGLATAIRNGATWE